MNRQHKRTINAVTMASAILAWAAILVALAALAGWAIDSSVAKSVLPGSVAMNPATAVSFILAGIALLILRRQDRSLKWRHCARGLGLLVALVGIWKLATFF